MHIDITQGKRYEMLLCICIIWKSEAIPLLGCSIEILRDIYIYTSKEKKHLKSMKKIEDVGLNED